MVHVDAPAAAFTPLPPMVNVPVPAVAVIVGAPPQLLTTFGAAAMSTLAGSASLKVRPVRADDPAGLVMVKVSVAVRPTPMVMGPKAFVRAGRLWTVSPELVTLLVMRAVAPMLAAVLLYGPPGALLTVSTRTWQEATVAFIARPVTVMLPAAVATKAGLFTSAPPAGQLLCTLGVAATVTLAGSVSVKLIPDCAGLPAPLVMVKVSVEVPPTSIVVGLKALLSEAWITVSVWLVTLLVSTPPTVMLAAPLV